MSALLSWSKTIGTYKSVTSRSRVLDACCYRVHSAWLWTSWSLLLQAAPFVRDFLLPGPSTALVGCAKTALKYAAAYAILGRVMAILSDDVWTRFASNIPFFRTPHSGWIFLPSATQLQVFQNLIVTTLEGGLPKAATCTREWHVKRSPACKELSSPHSKAAWRTTLWENTRLRSYLRNSLLRRK